MERSYANTVKKLFSLIHVGKELEIAASKPRGRVIEISRNCMMRLGMDITKLRVIHVAGTKGKGSTCSFAESILRHHSLKTGLFTSPHLIDVEERFRINGKPVERDIFIDHFWRVHDGLLETKDLAGDHPVMPGYFRFITLVAFSIFLAEEVDVAILEVGMGGRLDATNVIDKPIVCGISKLDLDHCSILGDTIGKIAFEKAGIMKPEVPIFTVPQESDAAVVLKERSEIVGSPLMCLEGVLPRDLDLGLKGEHQFENAELAVNLCNTFLNSTASDESVDYSIMKSYDCLSNTFLEGLKNCRWPGRADYLRLNDSVEVFMDGAHTPKSMICCQQWYSKEMSSKPDNTSVLVFNAGHSRDIGQLMLPLCASTFKYAYFCPMDFSKPTLDKQPTVVEILELVLKALLESSDDEKVPLGSTYGLSVDDANALISRVQENIDRINSIPSSDDEKETVKVTKKAKDMIWCGILKNVWSILQPTCDSSIIPSVNETVKFLTDMENTSILLTGSLYLVGDFMKHQRDLAAAK